MSHESSKESEQRKYERSDVRFRHFMAATGTTLAAVAAVCVALIFFMRTLSAIIGPPGAVHPPSTKGIANFPEPRLQVSEESAAQSEFSRKQTELTSYGWIDRNKGIVRIPISDAMKTLVAHGLPVRPATVGATEWQIEQQKGQTREPPSPPPEDNQ